MMSVGEADPSVLFERWFVAPLIALEALPNGDGAFVAFSTSLALYERFARSAIDAAAKKANNDALFSRLGADFGLTAAEAKEFWEVMRNGLQHQAMPMQKKQGDTVLAHWLFNGSFTVPIHFFELYGERVLGVQPWLFRDVVIALYYSNPEMIVRNQSFPWAAITLIEMPS